MPDLRPEPRELTQRQRRRPGTARTLLVLLLVFVFCVSAGLASGAFDEGIDPSEASTRILTASEAQQMAEESASAQRSGEESVPVALIAALLLVAGMLLITLAVPKQKPAQRSRWQTPEPVAPRRQMGAGIPEPMPAPPVTVAPVPVPAPDPPVERRFRAGAIMR